MAIHADYPGLTVEIFVDGRPLEEYKNPEEKDVPKTTTQYVECRSAKEPLVTFQFKYRSIAALKSLGMIPRSPSPPPVPQPELIKKEELPESIPNVPSSARSSSATPRPKSASTSATPAPLQRSPNIRTHHDQSKLTKKDMLILIKHYRGSSEGLESLPEKELAILLGSYRNDETERTPIKREPVDDGAARGQAKKRKPEVIVLDD
ncbi:hypothetical protein J4E85_003145 [Alternaria conjuncta]|uniref:uncharacterized protein n=1 Tax=Alternaria conjuncta TaxID=181017 RepID=UPI00221EEB75|nr:uncharacterized protein J4E85_003145 [Alternaria conjuncta]KAI4932745.1 hypothetical protein J4E85_003145 [Alternaria conjuncta]